MYFSSSDLQTFDSLNSTRPSPARPKYLKNNNLCRKTNENVRNKSRLLKSAYVRAFSAWPTTCLAAEGKIRALTPITPILTFSGRVGAEFRMNKI